MARKQTLTDDNVKTDIRNILKYPANISHEEHLSFRKRDSVLLIVLFVALLVFHNYYELVLALEVVAIMIYLAVGYLRKLYSIKNVSLDDYEIKEEDVSHIKKEVYLTSKRISKPKKVREVCVYIMHFQNGKTWNMPRDNYTWSGECPMSDRTIYELTQIGDIFLSVTKKDTGEVIMAYPTTFFEYKN